MSKNKVVASKGLVWLCSPKTKARRNDVPMSRMREDEVFWWSCHHSTLPFYKV